MTFNRRTGSLTGPAKVIHGDIIVVADQPHGIDAPELDQTFQWRGQQIACGTMSLAALEARIAGVKVRCEVIERDRHGRIVAKVFSPGDRRHVLSDSLLTRSGRRDSETCYAQGHFRSVVSG